MKTLKKALSIVLALALMLSCVAGMQVSVSAEGEEATTPALVLSANNPQYDLAKEVDLEPEKVGLVGVSVRVNANAGFAALGYEVTYDDALALNFVVKDGNITDYPITEENQAASSEKLTDKPYKMQWAFVENQTASEFTIAYLQFKLPEAVAADTQYNVTFTVKEAWDEAGNAVAVTESFTSTISVVDTTPVACEHANKNTNEEVTLAPTCTVVGSKTVTTTCVDCGEVLSTETVEIPATGEHVDADSNGACDSCGTNLGPAVDSKLVVAGAGVGFASSSLQVNFRIRKTVIQLYDKVELVIIPQKYDGTTFNLVAEPTEIVPELTLNGAFYTYAYTDIKLCDLGLNIAYELRAYDAEGNFVAVSEPAGTVPADTLKSLYASSTNNPEMRTLITDILVVGDEAAKMYIIDAPDSDLAKAPSILEGFDTSEATADVTDYNTIDEFNSYNASYGNKSSDTYYAAKSAAIGTAPYLNFRLRDRQALDVSKFSVKVTYSTQSLSGPITSYDKTFTASDLSIVRSGQFITFGFKEISFCDSDKSILFEFYYDGAKVYDVTYSIESYLSANTSTAKINNVVVALMKLGASARALSAKNAAAA